MAAVTLPEDTPEVFRAAVERLRDATIRPELAVHEVPGPGRVAPFSAALAADLVRDGEEVATGRFVVLHDPAGQDAWDGTTRVVVFVRAQLDDDMAGDPLLAEVTWSWLSEALDAHGAGHRAASGTVTTTASTRFGTMADRARTHEVELRCSWTPAEEGALVAHLAAYCDLIASMAGLPPSLPGVVPLARRRQR